MTVLLTELIAGSDENSNERSKTPVTANGEDQDHHRSDEQVNICLECMADSMRNLKRRFLRLSSQATIMHLKKFIALKLYNNLGRFKDVSYSCVVWLCRHCTAAARVLQDVLQSCVYVITVRYKTWGTSRCVTFVLCVYIITVHCNTWGTSGCVTIVSMSSWCTTTPGVLQDVLQLCVYVIMEHYNTWGTSRCVTIVSMSSRCTATPGVLQDVLQLCLCHHGALQHLRYIKMCNNCVYVIMVHYNSWGTSRCVTVVCLCHGALQNPGYFKMCYSCVFMSSRCTATPGVLQHLLQLCVYVITVHCNTWGTSTCVTIVCLSSWCTATLGVLQDVLQLCSCHHGALQHLGYFKMCYNCVFMSSWCTAKPGVLQDVLQLCCVFMSSRCTATPGVLQDVLQLCVYVIAVQYNTWGTSRCVTVVCLCHCSALQHLG